VIEIVWLCLGAIAFVSYQARPYVFALFVMWWMQVWMLDYHPGDMAEIFSVAMDIWAATICVLTMPRRRPLWALLVVWLFSVSLIGQAYFWLRDTLGYHTEWPHYYFGLTVFTAQLLCLSYPGGRLLVHHLLFSGSMGIGHVMGALQRAFTTQD